jgi:hypothetical protein
MDPEQACLVVAAEVAELLLTRLDHGDLVI